MIKRCCWVLLLVLPLLMGASLQRYPFQQSQQAKRFYDLSKQLRCLVCQNESLADSNAPLALDLRRQVYQMMLNGKTDQSIKHYLVSRYGNFILFKPPMLWQTLLLWLLPFVFLLLALWVWRRSLSRQADDRLNSDEQQQVDALLQDDQTEAP